MAVDVLAVCAHPDDAELGCAGLLLRCKAAGARVGVVDLTRGELGTRGNAKLRDEERSRATAILGLDVRLDLDLPDGFVERTVEYRTRLVEVIRNERPRMLVGPYWEDHHPDHVNTSLLMKDAWWFAGVAKHPGGPVAHRPEAMLFQLSRYVARPSLIVGHQRAVRHQGARGGVLRLATAPFGAGGRRRRRGRRGGGRGAGNLPVAFGLPGRLGRPPPLLRAHDRRRIRRGLPDAQPGADHQPDDT